MRFEIDEHKDRGEAPLRILQVSMRDRLGGAERVASDLLNAYRQLGHQAWMAVGQKRGDDPNVHVIPHHQTPRRWARFWWKADQSLQPIYGRFPGSRSLCRFTHRLAEPRGGLDRWRGIEDFCYPGTWRLLEMTPERPDILHAHNLHNNYFDLRALPWLSRRVPVVITCHDLWLTTGHCAHSLGCERWRTGCGQCPDLTIHPAVRRDATAHNWRRKRDIFAECRLYVAAPSRGMLERLRASMLAPAMIEGRVIPNGVDLSVYQPGDRRAARAELGLPLDVRVMVFAANGIRRNAFKDYPTLREAVGQVASRMRGQRIVMLAVGEESPPERIREAEVRFVGFQSDSRLLARYYQAADIYVHAARAEAWGLTITEALACGTPVVATAVGGIPDQIRSLPGGHAAVNSADCTYDEERATGVLVPMGDAEAMSAALAQLIENPALCTRLGANAARDARERFGLSRQATSYVDWFREILDGPKPCQRALPRQQSRSLIPIGMRAAGIG